MKTDKLLATLILLLGVLLSGWTAIVQASSDLYSAEVAVADDSATLRNQAMQQALLDVLVRLSGRADIGGHAEVPALIERAPSLVQQFRYRLQQPQTQPQSRPEPEPELESEPQSQAQAETGVEPADPSSALPPAPQRYLWVNFDKVGLQRLLRSAGIPVWSSRRPKLLVWLALEKGGERQLLNLEMEPDAANSLNRRAAERGLPLQLPLMDLLDQSALSPADIWAGYQAAIEEASARYPHDVVLTGRLRQFDDQTWLADWTLWDGEVVDNFEHRGMLWDPTLVAGIDAVQDRLAARYAPAAAGEPPQTLRVRFTGISDLTDYGRLMQRLQQQDVITQVALRKVDRQGVLTDLSVRGGRSALARSLALGGELFLQPSETTPRDLADPAQQQPQPVSVDMSFSFLPPVSSAASVR